MLSRKGKHPVTQVSTCRVLRLGNLPEIYASQKLGRSGLDRMIRCHMTNAEVGAPLKLPFALLNVSCSQDDTAISLSTEVAGCGFSEWLHVCRLQAPLLALEAEFCLAKLLVRWRFHCRKIVTYHIASPERLEFIGWISLTVPRIFSYHRDWIIWRLTGPVLCSAWRLYMSLWPMHLVNFWCTFSGCDAYALVMFLKNDFQLQYSDG